MFISLLSLLILCIGFIICSCKYSEYREKKYYEKLLRKFKGHKVGTAINGVNCPLPYMIDNNNDICYLHEPDSYDYEILNINNKMFLYKNDKYYIVTDENKRKILDRLEKKEREHRISTERYKKLARDYHENMMLIDRKGEGIL